MSIIEDITPAPSDLAIESGWQSGGRVINLGSCAMLGHRGETVTVTFLDGRTPIIGEQDVRTYLTELNATLLHNNNKENTMPESVDINYPDQGVSEVSGLIERYTTGLTIEQYIGADRTSAVAIKQVRQPWADLRRDCTVAYVSLDLEPEMKGRPQNARPGVEQIVWLGLPEWHPLFEANEREIAVIRYLPRTSYLFDVLDGSVVRKLELASAYDASGYVAVIGYCSSLEQAEDQATELRQAVKSHSQGAEDADDPEDMTDPAAGRFGNRAAWGL